MTAEAFWALVICVTVIAACALTAVLRLTERRFPAFSRWLDEHVGQEPEWRRW